MPDARRVMVASMRRKRANETARSDSRFHASWTNRMALVARVRHATASRPISPDADSYTGDGNPRTLHTLTD